MSTIPPPLNYFRGRVGLYHLLRILGVGPGDEVLLQAFTCLAVPEAIMAVGATPVWVDLAPGSVNLAPEDCASKVTAKTKAIVVQHTFGIPADFHSVAEIARTHNLPIIEDCCHSFASTYHSRPLGSLGAAAFWSYEWGKPVVAGIGGAARFNDPERHRLLVASHARELTPPPARKEAVLEAQYAVFMGSYSPRTFWWVRRAFRTLGKLRIATSNYNPVGPEVAMAADFSWHMARGAGRRLPQAQAQAVKFEPKRRQQADFYLGNLRPSSCQFPVVPPGGEAVYSRFPLFVANKQEVIAAASRANLEVAEWFSTPVHPLDGQELNAVHYRPGSCPVAENAARHILSLPVHPKVTPRFQAAVTELINRHGRA
jgi:perosamine synthetase